MGAYYEKPPIVPAPPNLPVPAMTYSSAYQNQLTNVLRLFFTGLCNAVKSIIVTQVNYELNGTSTFAASNTLTVRLSVPQLSNTYQVLLGGNAAGYCWVTSKTTTSFIINCSASNSNSTDWQVFP